MEGEAVLLVLLFGQDRWKQVEKEKDQFSK